MKKALHIIILLTAMSISACTKINISTEQPGTQYPYIFFDAEVLQTKAMLNSDTLPYEAGTDFGVFGYKGDSESTTPVFVDKQGELKDERMYRKTDNGSFLYDNLVLWTEDSYDFYAYYPYISGTQIGMHETKGAYVTYTQPTSLNDMIDFIDFMTASKTGVTYALGSLINLEFDHRLFAFDVELENATSGSLTISSATITLHDVASEATLYYNGDVETSGSLSIIKEFSFDPGTVAEGSTLTLNGEDSFLLLPTSSLTVSFKITGTDGFGDFDISVDTQTITSDFKAGQRYKMVISKLDGEGFMATVSGWDEGGEIKFTFN